MNGKNMMKYLTNNFIDRFTNGDFNEDIKEVELQQEDDTLSQIDIHIPDDIYIPLKNYLEDKGISVEVFVALFIKYLSNSFYTKDNLIEYLNTTMNQRRESGTITISEKAMHSILLYLDAKDISKKTSEEKMEALEKLRGIAKQMFHTKKY